MCQLLSSKASTKACRFHGMNTQLPLLQLSINRELVATWQPNTPLLISNLCFVVDLSSFNKPVLGTIVRALPKFLTMYDVHRRTGSTLLIVIISFYVCATKQRIFSASLRLDVCLAKDFFLHNS